MLLPCNILASVLLLCNCAAKGAASETVKNILGILDRDVTLDIPGFKMDKSISDIRWYKGESKNRIAVLKDQKAFLEKEYELLQNGSLRIKNLTEDFNDIYKVEVYGTNGKNLMERKISLTVLEMVSMPEISWDCVNTSLTCKVMKGSELELQLLQNGIVVKKEVMQKVITFNWHRNQDMSFTCTATNQVSREDSVVNFSCTEKNLNLYIIFSIIGGGVLVFVLLAMLIFCINKKGKLCSWGAETSSVQRHSPRHDKAILALPRLNGQRDLAQVDKE
ncbi:T-cell surface antigen CD2 [Tenrec ecaudatus]|uniref:T-cell surface antigen CD2 n=1 Tax=Tenrec ecaudatus TaxID=94439 RepID=UPI003F59E26A